MSNAEILEKAIAKAIEGGWNLYLFMECEGEPTQWRVHDNGVLQVPLARGGSNMKVLHDYLYDHDFAKSFFGTNEVCFSCGLENKHDPYCAERTSYDEAWKYHLRDMVISPDPIQYLAENMEGKE